MSVWSAEGHPRVKSGIPAQSGQRNVLGRVHTQTEGAPVTLAVGEVVLGRGSGKTLSLQSRILKNQ